MAGDDDLMDLFNTQDDTPPPAPVEDDEQPVIPEAPEPVPVEDDTLAGSAYDVPADTAEDSLVQSEVAGSRYTAPPQMDVQDARVPGTTVQFGGDPLAGAVTDPEQTDPVRRTPFGGNEDPLVAPAPAAARRRSLDVTQDAIIARNAAYFDRLDGDPRNDPAVQRQRDSLLLVERLHRTGIYDDYMAADPAQRRRMMGQLIHEEAAQQASRYPQRGQAKAFANIKNRLNLSSTGIDRLPEFARMGDQPTPSRMRLDATPPLAGTTVQGQQPVALADHDVLRNRLQQAGLYDAFKAGDAKERKKILKPILDSLTLENTSGATGRRGDIVDVRRAERARLETSVQGFERLPEFDPTQQPAAAPAKPQKTSWTTDFKDMLVSAGTGAVRGIGGLVQFAGEAGRAISPSEWLDDQFGALRGFGDVVVETGKKFREGYVSQTTLVAEAALDRAIKGGNAKDIAQTIYDNPRLIFTIGADSIGQLAGAGGGATAVGRYLFARSLAAGTTATLGLAASTGGQSGQEVAEAFAGLRPEEQQKYALYRDVQTVLEAKHGRPPTHDEVAAATSDVMRSRATALTAGVTAATTFLGLGAEAQMLRQVGAMSPGTVISKGLVGRTAERIGVGAAGEYIQEGAQAASEQFVAGQARTGDASTAAIEAVTSQETSNRAVLGAIMGGAFGAVTPGSHRPYVPAPEPDPTSGFDELGNVPPPRLPSGAGDAELAVPAQIGGDIAEIQPGDPLSEADFADAVTIPDDRVAIEEDALAAARVRSAVSQPVDFIEGTEDATPAGLAAAAADGAFDFAEALPELTDAGLEEAVSALPEIPADPMSSAAERRASREAAADDDAAEDAVRIKMRRRAVARDPELAAQAWQNTLAHLHNKEVETDTGATMRMRVAGRSLDMTVTLPDGTEVGSFTVQAYPQARTAAGDRVLNAVSVTRASVPPEYRRAGVARRVYDFLRTTTGDVGLRVVPQGRADSSPDAQAFWRNYDPETATEFFGLEPEHVEAVDAMRADPEFAKVLDATGELAAELGRVAKKDATPEQARRVDIALDRVRRGETVRQVPAPEVRISPTGQRKTAAQAATVLRDIDPSADEAVRNGWTDQQTAARRSYDQAKMALEAARRMRAGLLDDLSADQPASVRVELDKHFFFNAASGTVQRKASANARVVEAQTREHQTPEDMAVLAAHKIIETASTAQDNYRRAAAVAKRANVIAQIPVVRESKGDVVTEAPAEWKDLPSLFDGAKPLTDEQLSSLTTLYRGYGSLVLWNPASPDERWLMQGKNRTAPAVPLPANPRNISNVQHARTLRKVVAGANRAAQLGGWRQLQAFKIQSWETNPSTAQLRAPGRTFPVDQDGQYHMMFPSDAELNDTTPPWESRGPVTAGISPASLGGIAYQAQQRYANVGLRTMVFPTVAEAKAAPQAAPLIGDRDGFNGLMHVDEQGRATMILIADRIRDAAHAQQIIDHEVLGHYALEHMLGGERMAGFRGLVYQATRTDPTLRTMLAEVQADYPLANGYTPVDHVNEVVARIAEGRTVTPTASWADWPRKILDALRNLLASAGVGRRVQRMSYAELQDFIAREVRDYARAMPGSAMAVPSLYNKYANEFTQSVETLNGTPVIHRDWAARMSTFAFDSVGYLHQMMRLGRSRGQDWSKLERLVRNRDSQIARWRKGYIFDNQVTPLMQAVENAAQRHGMSRADMTDWLGRYGLARHAPEVNQAMWERNVRLASQELEERRTDIMNRMLRGELDGRAARQAIQSFVTPDNLHAEAEPRDTAIYAGITDAEAAAILRAANDQGLTASLAQIFDTEVSSLRKAALSLDLESGVHNGNYIDFLGYQNYVPRKGLTKEGRASTPVYDRDTAFNATQGATRGRHALPLDERVPRNMIGQMIEDALNAGTARVDKEMFKELAKFIEANPDFGRVEELGPPVFDKDGVNYAALPTRFDTDTFAFNDSKGRQYRLEITDPELVQTLSRRRAEPDELQGVRAYTAAMTRALGRFYTAWSPAYISLALQRDLFADTIAMAFERSPNGRPKTELVKRLWGNFHAEMTNLSNPAQRDTWRLMTSGEGERLLLIEQWQANPEVAERTKYLREFFENGGVTDFAKQYDVRGVVTGAKDDPLAEASRFDKATKALEAIGTYTDNAHRVAMYKTLRESGVPVDEALNFVRTTMDFNQKSDLGRKFGGLYVFLQPALTGTQRMFTRAIWKGGQMPTTFEPGVDPQGNPVVVERLADDWLSQLNTPMIATLMAAGAMQVLVAGALMGQDDLGEDEARKITPGSWFRNIVLPTSGSPLLLGQAYGVQQVFTGLGSAAALIAMGYATPGEAAREYTNTLLQNTVPGARLQIADDNRNLIGTLVSGLAPSLLSPIVQYATNTNAFASEIERPSNPGSAQQYRSDSGRPSTPGGYADLATGVREMTGIDMTPEAYRHFLQSYLPGGVMRGADSFLKALHEEKGAVEALGAAAATTAGVRFDRSAESFEYRELAKMRETYLDPVAKEIRHLRNQDIAAGEARPAAPFQKFQPGPRERAFIADKANYIAAGKAELQYRNDMGKLRIEMTQARQRGDEDAVWAITQRQKTLTAGHHLRLKGLMQ